MKYYVWCNTIDTSIPFPCFLRKVSIGKTKLTISGITPPLAPSLFLGDEGPWLEGYDAATMFSSVPRHGCLRDAEDCYRPLDIPVPSVGKRCFIERVQYATKVVLLVLCIHDTNSGCTEWADTMQEDIVGKQHT